MVNKTFKKYKSILISMATVSIILLIVYMLKRVYPFGDRNISYYDMSQLFVPLYYNTYDVLHGTKSLLWNWNSAAGVSMVDSLGNYIISPFSLFFYFVPRSKILESMSFFLMLKISACAGTMSFYSVKSYEKLNTIWHVIIGIMYASCGFLLQYYAVLPFLDIVVLFPLIIYFTDCLLKKGKIVGYTICMALGMVVNLYLAVMVCLYVVLYAAYHIGRMEELKKKQTTLTLGLSTLFSFMLGAVVLIPNIVSWLSSARMTTETNLKIKYLLDVLINQYFYNKCFMVYGAEIGIAAAIYMFIRNRQVTKKIWPYIRVLIFLLLPIYFEIVNELWHVGGYVEFPMRFGYMISFTALCMLGRCFLEEQELPALKKESRLSRICTLIGIAIIPFLAIAMYGFVQMFITYGIRDNAAFAAYWSAFLIITLTFVLAFFIHDNRIKYTLCVLAVAIQCFVGWIGLLAPVEEMLPECADDVIVYGELLRDELYNPNDETENAINRVKDVSTVLNANYPFITSRAALANWTYGTNTGLLELMRKLGYSKSYTRLLDGGGTAFSDAVLHITNTITINEPNQQLYSLDKKVSEFYINSCNYIFPFGIVVNEDSADALLYDENTNPLECQKNLWRALFGTERGELISIINSEEYLVDETQEEAIHYYAYEVPVTRSSVLYLQANQEHQYRFNINGNLYTYSDLTEREKTIYPGYFNNGIIECGFYENETVTIIVECPDEISEDTISFGLLDVFALGSCIEDQSIYERSICTTKNGLQMDINNTGDNQYLVLPIAMASDYVVKVNGKEMPCRAVGDALLQVEIAHGDNHIDIKYVPKGIKVGAIISLLAVIGFCLFYRFMPRIVDNRVLGCIAFALFQVVEKGFITIAYVIPIIVSLAIKIFYKP